MNHRTLLAILFLLFAFFTHCGFAAEFLRRQAGTTTFTGSSTTVTIPTTLADMSKSILVFSATINDANPRNILIGGEITNTTTLTFARASNTGTVSISWEVVEFENGVYVQRGSSVVAENTNVDITIGCVDLNQSFVMLSGRNDGSNLGTDDGLTGNLTSETNLRLLSGTLAGDHDMAYWQVIEYQGASVQKLTGSLTGTSLTSTIPTAVDMSKTMVISNHLFSGDANASDLPRTALTATNQVTYTRNTSGITCNFVTYVVEFTDQTTMARGSASFTSGTTSQTVTGLTTAASSAVFPPGNFGRQGSTSHNSSDNTGHGWFTYRLASSTTLQINRAVGTSSTAVAPWQIVTFENADDGLQKSTFYSIGSGDWESSAVWSYTPDGSSGAVPDGVYPGRDNDVVIQNGHSITIDDVTDNDPCSVSPDGLGLSNVGPFTGSGDQMFYHTGDLIIADGGSLSSSEEIMLAGYTLIENGGSFTATEDIINLGYLEVSSTATFGSSLDDLILSGNSYTIIDNTSTTADDIYIDHTDAQLCGAGTVEIGNGGPNPIINWFNPGTSRFNQICDGFDITCNTNCTGGSTGSGTGGFSNGNSGPGGVGTTDGTSSLEYWIDANNGVTGSSPITAWTDLSGNSVTNTVNGDPALTTSSLNGQSVITFDGTGDFIQTNLDISESTYPDLTIISIYVPDNSTYKGSVWGESDGGFDRALTSANVGSCDYSVTNGTACVDAITLFPNSASVITSVIFDEDAASGSEVFTNGTSVLTFTSNHSAAGTASNMQVGDVGAGLSLPFSGDIAEMMVFSGLVNDAKRIIIENYLDAKYHNDAAPAFSNDVYTMDNSANGDYDFEVAGIGQAADGSNHKDAQGTGILRMWNPNDLDNGEFLMWGHDNTAINSTTTGDVDGTVIQQRLSRVWGVSENSGDVGTVSLSFDFSSVGGNPLGSNLRLLIDRDGDGFADNDVTPIEGSVSNGIAVFSNVNLQDGDLITLGNTDVSIPLPIELLEFEVFQEGEKVVANWTTVTELNNDFFTLERSGDGNNWIPILKLDGAGTTNQMQSYQAVDDQPIRGLVYYRLKQTDYDGQFSYSPVKMIEIQFINDIKIFPNPSNRVFNISGVASEGVAFSVFNILGQQVPFSIIEEDGLQIDLGNGPVGVYLVKVKDGQHVKTFQVIKK